jgi:hypothetical protein
VLRQVLGKNLSGTHVVHSSIHVKFWAESVPSVEVARPGRCPCCRGAGRPVGAALGLVGHGLRERQVRGPRSAGGRPQALTIRVRRYRCGQCRAVCTVVPRGVVRRRHFSAGAIGWAFFLVGYEHLTSCEVRDLLGGLGPSEATSWVTLRRWLSAARRGALLCTRAAASAQQSAEHIAMALISFAPPDVAMASLGEQAFAGAEVIAHAA